MFDGLPRQFLFDRGFRSIVAQDLEDGQHRNPDQRSGWWTTAYFHRPDELCHEVSEAGLAVRELVGLEGLALWLPQLAGRWADPNDSEAILWSARAIESEPSPWPFLSLWEPRWSPAELGRVPGIRRVAAIRAHRTPRWGRGSPASV